jgi:hypothetical protein
MLDGEIMSAAAKLDPQHLFGELLNDCILPEFSVSAVRAAESDSQHT